MNGDSHSLPGSPHLENVWQALVERSPLPVWINYQGRIVYINSAGVKLLGAQHSGQIVGRPPFDFIAPEYHHLVHRRMLLAASGQGEDGVTTEQTFVRLDNTSVPVAVTPVFVPYEDGTAIQLYFADLTERNRSQQALLQSEHHLRDVLDSLFPFVGVLTPDGILTGVNRSPLEASGVTRESVLGKPFWDTSWWNYDRLIQRQLRESIRQAREGQSCRYDVAVQVGHDQFITIDFMLAPMRDQNGAVTHLIASAVDITERVASEQARRETEERFRATFEQAAVGIAHVGLGGEWLRVNERLCQIVGYSREELANLTFPQITHPDDIQADWNFTRALVRGDIQTYSIEKRYIRRDGRVVWINLTASLVRDFDWQPRYFIAVVEQIDARKQAEAELRASEDRFRSLFNASPIPNYLIDPETARLVDLNVSAAKHLGYAPEELRGVHIAVFEAGMSLPEIDATLRSAASGEGFSRESRHRTRTDEVREVYVTATPLQLEGRTLVYASVLDITERKQAEQTLRDFAATLEKSVEERTKELMAGRRFVQTVLDTIDVGVVSCDAGGRLTLFNRTTAEWHGEQAHPVASDDWANRYQLLEPDGHTPLEPERVPLWRALHGEVVQDAEMVIGSASVAPRLVRVSGRQMVDESGNQLGAVIAMHDITQQRQAEEQRRLAMIRLEEANRELESFAYSVSHDLRAPLRSIDGFSRILERDCRQKLDPASLDSIHRIQGAARRMGQLIDDLLNLSRISRHDFVRSIVHLSDIANNVIAGLRERTPERQVEVSVGPGIIARADGQLVTILLENLLSNAWKFTGKAEHARIEFGVLPGERPAIYFVHDNGAGFDMAFAGQLFRPFQRLHQASEFEGTGVGLATVRRIVLHHGGRIWADAQPGKGATFYFTLEPAPDAT